MRIKPDNFYDDITEEELKSEFVRIDEKFSTKASRRHLVTKLKNFHRHRSLTCWHDTSSISNAAHLLIMFSVLYDPAIFYTDKEYHDMTGLS